MIRKVISVAVFAALISGCVSTEKNSNVALQNNLKQGDTVEAIILAQKNAGFNEKDNEIEDQYWGMLAASLYRMNGQYVQSNKYFDLIEDVMYQEDTESITEKGGEAIGAIFTNDTFLDYEQTMFDSIMVNTYKALNFSAIGDNTNARVEWNRSDDRQRRAADYFAEKINEQKESLKKDAKKELDESGKQSSDSVKKSLSQSEKILAKQGIDMSLWSAYDGYINPFSTYMHGLYFMLNGQDQSDIGKAVDSLKRVHELANTNVTKLSLDIAKSIQEGQTSPKEVNKVWVVFENGSVAKKEEFRIDLPIFLVSDNVAYTGIALPKLKEQHDYFKNLTVGEVSTEVIADMDRIVKAEFKEEFPLILAREITRATVKTIAQKQLTDQNQLLGFAAGLAQAATTNADLRTWSLLPKNFQVAILDKPDDNQLIIESEGLAEPLTVNIGNYQNTVIYVKAIEPSMPAMVRVFNL